MNAETKAALKRLRSQAVGCETQAGLSALVVVQCADLKAALDHIASEAGERADVVAYARTSQQRPANARTGWEPMSVHALVRAIEAGEHVGAAKGGGDA